MRVLSVLFISIAVVMAGGCNRGAPPAAPQSTDRAAFLAGAAGEEIEPNFFIEDFRDFSASLAKRGWVVSIAAGAKDGELPHSVRAGNAQLLGGVRRALESVKSGGQALLVFHSHGRQRESRWGQRSHSIVSEERDASGVDIGFDLDVIEPELLKAQARGVRVGLVDLSCYSGGAQVLNGAACTVTLAAADYISICSGREEERSFSSHFLKLPSGPVSLEAQFLDARRKDVDSINLPQISSRVTPALSGWERFLREADPLDTYEELKNLQAGTRAFDARKLLGEVDAWIAKQGASKDLALLRAEIAKRLGAVGAIRKQLEGELKGLAADYDDPALTIELEGRAPIHLARASLAEALETVAAVKVPDGYTDVQRNLLKALEPQYEQINASQAVPLAQFHARRDRFDQLMEQMAQAAGALFEVERRFYDRASVVGGGSGCGGFVL
jgi:hypothetical protein